MLETYQIMIGGGKNTTIMDNVEFAIVMMEDYKQKFGKELRLPKGVRYNWFPLILLHKYKNMHNELSTTDQARFRRFLRKLCEEEQYFSFYLDDYKRYGNVLAITYRAHKKMNEEICTIFKIYGLELEE